MRSHEETFVRFYTPPGGFDTSRKGAPFAGLADSVLEIVIRIGIPQ
jgi:hypothetical protein